MSSATDERAVLRELSRARRSHFIEHHDLLTVIVKGYFAAIVAAIVLDIASNSSKFLTLSRGGVAFLVGHGGQWAGALVALALFVGVMSGTRGGPVAIHRGELRLLLLAPINREKFLSRKAIRALEHFAFVGIATGIAAGIAVHSIAQKSALLPVFSLAIFGLILALAYGAGATGALGLHLNKVSGYLIGALLLGLEVVSIYLSLSSNPFAISGTVAILWLVKSSSWPVVLFIWAALAAVGSQIAGRADAERVERHSELVSRLRFALSSRDVRSVILLSRALAEDGYRARSSSIRLWSLNSNPSSSGYLRSASNLAHWSPRRYLRLTLLLGASTWLIAKGWAGAPALYLFAIPLVFAYGLEFSDTLAVIEEKPDLFANYAVDDGWLLTRVLVVPMVVSVAVSLLSAVIVAQVVGGIPILVLLSVSFSLAISSVIGGAVAAVRSGSPPGIGSILSPETQAFGFFVELIPIFVANAWLLPAVNSRIAFLAHRPPEADAMSGAFFSLVIPLAAWAWIRAHKVLKAA